MRERCERGQPMRRLSRLVNSDFGKARARDVVMVFARDVAWGAELPKPSLHMFPREEAGGQPAFSVARLRAELDARLR